MKELLIAVIIACSSMLDGNASNADIERLDNAIMQLHNSLSQINVQEISKGGVVETTIASKYNAIPGGMSVEQWLIECRKRIGKDIDFTIACKAPYGISD